MFVYFFVTRCLAGLSNTYKILQNLRLVFGQSVKLLSMVLVFVVMVSNHLVRQWKSALAIDSEGRTVACIG